MSFFSDLLKWKVSRLSTDANGNTVLVGGDVSFSLPQMADPSLPILCIGGDHPYEQWYGSSDDGLAKMYRDYGITPYLSINTAIGHSAPGDSGYMTWAQLRSVESGGAEIIGHSHRHMHQWGRIDTGIRIQYLGANATATVHITGTPKTLTLTASAADDAAFDLTNVSYDTIAELAAAINAVNGGASWLCTKAEELTGSEPSKNLLALLAARSVKTPGDSEYFTCGSGIVVSYTGAAYKRAHVQVEPVNLAIYCDGVRLGNFTRATPGSYDTLGELVTAINALAISGLSAALCDDTAGIYRHYTQGDELSSEIGTIVYVDITNSGGITIDGTYKAGGARLSAGLPYSYLLERQWQANVDAAAAEGVTLLNWAQSGGGWHQWHLGGQQIFRSYRTNSPEHHLYPAAHWAAIGPDYIRAHYVLSSTYNSVASMQATLRAIAKSPGCMVDLLNHALTPATPAGKNGYTIQATTSLNTVDEDAWISVLAYAKALADAGDIVILTPEQARRRRKWAAKPQNLVFNSTLEHDGTAITGVSEGTTIIPGWSINTSAAHVTGASVVAAENYNKVSITANASTATDALRTYLSLERGKTYRIGAHIDVTSYTSGTGVGLCLLPVGGALPDQFPDDTSPTWSSALALANQDISMLVSIPGGSGEPPMLRGTVAGPFNIVAASTDTLSIAIDAYTAVVVALTAGAARTASQVADEINAAFAASAKFIAKEEYWTLARAMGGKVVIQSPYVGEEFYKRIVVTGNGAQTVFGGSQCIAPPIYSGSQPFYPLELRVRSAIIGTYVIDKPYCVEVSVAY